MFLTYIVFAKDKKKDCLKKKKYGTIEKEYDIEETIIFVSWFHTGIAHYNMAFDFFFFWTTVITPKFMQN